MHGAASLSGKLQPQDIPADSNTLPRGPDCHKYIDAQIPGCARHVCHTVKKKRAALDPDQVDRPVFLAKNMKK